MGTVADPAHALVLVELGRVFLPVGLALGLEQPAGVGVPQAAQAAAVSDVRAVRVALLVGVRVVLAVVGDPIQHRALDRQRAEDRERALEPRVGLERAVGQQPVEADRDADPVSRYITTRIARSVASTARFHSSTIAASTPANGTTTPKQIGETFGAGHVR